MNRYDIEILGTWEKTSAVSIVIIVAKSKHSNRKKAINSAVLARLAEYQAPVASVNHANLQFIYPSRMILKENSPV